jgi:ribosomal protein S21
MPTVEVYNGNLEDALAVFKQKTKQEGIVGAYKRSLAFTPAHEEKARKAYKQERRRRERAR